MSDPFPECDYFCLHAGRVSIFPSSCASAEEMIARDCLCTESPIAQNAQCLQRICTADEFSALLAAEQARCPGLVPSDPSTTLTRRAAAILSSPAPDSEQISSLSAAPTPRHLGCGSAALSSPFVFVFVPAALVLLAAVHFVCAYRRRRAARAQEEREAREGLLGQGFEVREKEGWADAQI